VADCGAGGRAEAAQAHLRYQYARLLVLDYVTYELYNAEHTRHFTIHELTTLSRRASSSREQIDAGSRLLLGKASHSV
jgi:hypothetical protein